MRRGLWTLLGLGALACVAAAQAPAPGGGGGPQGPGGGGPALGGGLSQRATPAQRDRLSEDIEVMRRLLERELRLVYGYPAASVWDGNMSNTEYAALSAWIAGTPQDRVN